MKWSDVFATGIAAIDEQHRMIFKMSEDFRAALDSGQGERVYGALLESLDLYARTHFRFEEECMDRYQCPVAEKNKQAHAKFVEVLQEFQNRFRISGFERPTAHEFVNIIDKWLADHICRIDLELKGYLGNP